MKQEHYSSAEVGAQARATVERAIQRHIPGLSLPPDLTVEVGTTPRDVVYARETLKLYHYRPLCDEIYRVPVLLVMSLVSRPYILDLAPGQSLIEYLLLQGFDVYLIDWGTPRAEHRTLRLEDYILDFLPDCIRVIEEETREHEVSLVGYCLGGLLAVLYAAVYPEKPLKNLACFTTPINSDGMSLYRTWTDPAHFDLDRLINTLGNIPPELIDASMQVLRPFQKSAGQMKLLDNVEDDAFVKAHLRFERWASDHIPFPGETARQLVTAFLRENKLARNEFILDRQRIDFGRIRVPFLHVTAEHDHIVPAAASADLIKLVGSEDKTEIVLKGGHVSLVAGANAVYRLWPKLDAWLSVRSV
ncbi:MAG: alpha/beta fold hydrolase [Candidatus Binatia bacterium]